MGGIEQTINALTSERDEAEARAERLQEERDRYKEWLSVHIEQKHAAQDRAERLQGAGQKLYEATSRYSHLNSVASARVNWKRICASLDQATQGTGLSESGEA